MTGASQETYIKVPFSLLLRLVERLEPGEMLTLWEWLDRRLAGYRNRQAMDNPVGVAELREARVEYKVEQPALGIPLESGPKKSFFPAVWPGKEVETASGLKSYLFRIEIEPEEDGRWSAYCPSLPGCNTWGNSLDEAIGYIQDAVRLYVEDLFADGGSLPRETLVLESPAVSVTI